MTPVTDLGGSVKSVVASASENSGAPSLVTAGGTGDASEVTGQSIDRKGYYSGVLAIPYLAALQADETLAFKVDIQESDDGSSWDTAETLQSSTTAATGESGGSNEHGVVEIDVNFKGRKRYARFNITPDLSASGTDTALFGAVAVLGGAKTLPAS